MYRKHNSSIHDAMDVCNMFDSSDESDSSEESDSSGESDSSEESDSADKSKTGYKSNNPRNTYNVEGIKKIIYSYLHYSCNDNLEMKQFIKILRFMVQK